MHLNLGRWAKTEKEDDEYHLQFSFTSLLGGVCVREGWWTGGGITVLNL